MNGSLSPKLLSLLKQAYARRGAPAAHDSFERRVLNRVRAAAADTDVLAAFYLRAAAAAFVLVGVVTASVHYSLLEDSLEGYALSAQVDPFDVSGVTYE
jgi:hypothetical protein